MKEHIILAFDIKEYSLPSSLERNTIKKKFERLTSGFFSKDRSTKFISTGDGYFIGATPSERSNIKLLNFITYLMDNLQEAEFRYALNVGNIEAIKDVKGQDSFLGDVLIESKRIMDSISTGNVILASQSYYRTFIGARLVPVKQIDDQTSIESIKQISIIDKHKIRYEAVNISIHKYSHKYGFEYADRPKSAISTDDAIAQEHYRSILVGSYPFKKIHHLKSQTDSQKRIIYHYFMVDFSNFSHECFLFLDKNINKIATIEHFLENNKIHKPLTICANKKHLEDERNQFWKNDFIAKLSETSTLHRHKDFVFLFLDEFIWENCMDGSDFEDEHTSDYEPHYVNPLAEIDHSHAHEKHALNVVKHMENWVTDGERPIFFLLGEGGIGKTTVLKKLVNRINKSKWKKLALYIDASLISGRIMYETNYSDRISTIYDLLNLYFTSINPEASFSFSKSQDFINLVISSGNIIIVIDGLDEIAASLKENFSIREFIDSITDLNGLLNHSKIIFSSRNYYWEAEHSNLEHENFDELMLKGFNETLSKKYFEKKLGKNSGLVNEAVNVLKSFSQKSQQEFSPFIVYLVSDIVQKKESDLISLEFDSKYLDVNYTFDNIIAQVCERERLRQSLNMGLDDFMELFFEIVFVAQNNMTLDDFSEYMTIALENKVEYVKPLLSNPFLSVKNGRVSVSHSSVENHLVVIFLDYYILHPHLRSNAVYKILSRYCDGKTDVLSALKQRIQTKQNYETSFKNFFKQVIQQLKRERDIKQRYFLEKSVSTLLYIAMSSSKLGSINTPKDRTNVLIDLYDNQLENIHIYDEFTSLDFSNLRISNSSFNNYKGFFRSRFNHDTRFIDTKFSHMLTGNLDFVKDTSLTRENFDTSCTFTDEFDNVIAKSNGDKFVVLRLIKSDLMNLLKKFYMKNTRFVAAKRESLKMQMRSGIEFHLFLDVLEKEKVIEQTVQKAYRVKQECKDSISKFISNNYPDSVINSLISKIYNSSVLKS